MSPGRPRMRLQTIAADREMMRLRDDADDADDAIKMMRMMRSS